jgi:hypothetical protein
MTITPDDKDWTWVLSEPCPECGVDVSAFPRERVAGLTHELGPAWTAVRLGGAVAERPSPGRWSALEYGCHVRDVLRIYHERLGLMITGDDPLYANWDQDAAAVEHRYAEQDPAVVAGELRQAAQVLGDAFAAVGGDQWSRPGRRSDGARFDVESFGRYFIHDPLHHLWDVGRPLAL